MRTPRFLLAALVALTACDEPPASPELPTGPGLFAEGCPPEGQAVARVIGVDDRLPGVAAVGTAGDLLLANDRAAFVITDAVGQSTYWYYGGALADAAAVSACTPHEDKLDELGFVFVVPDIFSFEQSILRAFRADTVTVLNDGSDGGAAIVRAEGSDDIHWLVEHTLIKEAADNGGRPYSEPYDAAITLDYILAPGSAVLQIDINVRNTGDSPFQLVDAALFQHGATMDEFTYAGDRIDLAGLNLDAGLPWLLASDGDGAYALGIPDANLATVSFSGVQVGVDIAQLADGFSLSPSQSKTLTRYFAIGAGDGATAIEPLLAANPSPLNEQAATAGLIEATLVDAAGSPTAGTVLVQVDSPESDWGDLYRGYTADGQVRVVVPEFAAAWGYRLVAEGPGRDASPAVDVAVGESVTLTLQPEGELAYTLTADGAPSPARVHLRRDDGRTLNLWLAGDGTAAVPPGTWDWTATRGYEFAPARGTVTIPTDGSASLAAALSHVVDTTGWISVDTHVHSSDSPDSRIPPETRLQEAAAHGLDIVIHTEHENIVDRSYVPVEAGVADWVNNVIGEEVTSVAVEHMTMFPAVPDGSPRGGFVEWYGMDIDQLFDAMRTRSNDGVNIMNHPGWLDLIGWDRVAGQPTLDDPTLLGFAGDAPLWSWNLDGIEVMNGHGNIFHDGSRRFDNWMSMVNHGHPMIAVGCSDAHGMGVGFPRTYVSAPSDDPAQLSLDALVDSFRGGQAMASTGAFARVSIDGEGPGGRVTDTDGSVELDLQIQALPEIDVTHFVVFVNCDQALSVVATDPGALTKHDGTLTVPVPTDGDAHVVVAAFGAESLPPGLPQYNGARSPRVLTSPIYVDGDGDGEFSAPGGRECTYDVSFGAAQ